MPVIALSERRVATERLLIALRSPLVALCLNAAGLSVQGGLWPRRASRVAGKPTLTGPEEFLRSAILMILEIAKGLHRLNAHKQLSILGPALAAHRANNVITQRVDANADSA